MFKSEFLKLKRSSVWVVCVIIPLLSVGLGTLNYSRNLDQLTGEWESLSAQAGLFYALIFFNVGAAVIVSTVWKDDLKKENWLAIRMCLKEEKNIFLAKAVVGVALVVTMHVIFTALTIVVAWFMGFRDVPLGDVAKNALLVFVATVPIVVFQSFITYVTKSFSWPIGICLILCVSGFAVVTSQALGILVFIVPQALSTFALAASSAAFAVGGSYGAGLVKCVAAASLLTVVYLLLTVALFTSRRRKA